MIFILHLTSWIFNGNKLVFMNFHKTKEITVSTQVNLRYAQPAAYFFKGFDDIATGL